MVHKILFWSGFGLAVRFWQLGIEMRPFFNRQSLWAYPVYAAVGGSFGYWLTGVHERQTKILTERKHSLLEKRRRRAEKEENGGIVDGAVGAKVGGEESGDGRMTGGARDGRDGGFLLGRS